MRVGWMECLRGSIIGQREMCRGRGENRENASKRNVLLWIHKYTLQHDVELNRGMQTARFLCDLCCTRCMLCIWVHWILSFAASLHWDISFKKNTSKIQHLSAVIEINIKIKHLNLCWIVTMNNRINSGQNRLPMILFIILFKYEYAPSTTFFSAA